LAASSRDRLGCLDPATQHFSDTPRLGDATAFPVRLARIEHFTDRADAGFSEMVWKGFEESPRRFRVVGMKL